MSKPTPLGARLLELIEKRGTTMHRVSLDAGLSPSAVRQWIYTPKIAGRPKPENLAAVAKVLDADYTELLQLAGHPVPTDIKRQSPQARLIVERLHELEQLSPARAAVVTEAILYLIELLESVSDDLDDETGAGKDVSLHSDVATVGADGDPGDDRPADSRVWDGRAAAAATRAFRKRAVHARLLADL